MGLFRPKGICSRCGRERTVRLCPTCHRSVCESCSSWRLVGYGCPFCGGKLYRP